MCEINGEQRPSPWNLTDLTVSERAILTGVRQWFKSGTAGAMAAMRTGLGVAGVPVNALLPLFALLGTFAVTGAGQPEIRCPACSRVSADEAALLDALASLQAGDVDGATQCLDRWLPLVALCMASDAMRELADILWVAGVRLPRRRPARIIAMAAE